jgi:ribonuclease Z
LFFAILDTIHLLPFVLIQLGLTQCQTVAVDHCFDAYGVALAHVDGWKIVFSGDTRPCEALARVGANANLVIHEATFEDDKPKDAVDKFHSTIAEAITIAKLYVFSLLMIFFHPLV